MDIAITGTVKQVLEEQSGESQRGPWRKQEFILETEGQYPKEICIVQWGEKIDEFDIQEGERLTAHVDIQSREYNGRWYTDVKAWRIERDDDALNQERPGMEYPEPQVPPEPDDDLPF